MLIEKLFEEMFEYPVTKRMTTAVANVHLMLAKMREIQPEGVIHVIGTGTSGAMVGTLLCLFDDKIQHILLKKNSEQSHRGTIAGSKLRYAMDYTPRTHTTWLIDDQVSTGATLRYMLDILRHPSYKPLDIPRSFRLTGVMIPACEKDGMDISNLYPDEMDYFFY